MVCVVVCHSLCEVRASSVNRLASGADPPLVRCVSLTFLFICFAKFFFLSLYLRRSISFFDLIVASFLCFSLSLLTTLVSIFVRWERKLVSLFFFAWVEQTVGGGVGGGIVSFSIRFEVMECISVISW